RTWGWTGPSYNHKGLRQPSPTHVGMDRSAGAPPSLMRPEPHARGDGPAYNNIRSAAVARAPRTWGWTGGQNALGGVPAPSPTHVGMDRALWHNVRVAVAEPHARGDGPTPNRGPTESCFRAPRTWGWTGHL